MIIKIISPISLSLYGVSLFKYRTNAFTVMYQGILEKNSNSRPIWSGENDKHNNVPSAYTYVVTLQ